ncbi:GGDEF domain-containing protein [Legionella massiliensis]|uniref:GGDEF domain-containing protein n=1 Tax=Legionella massiliensis TaxID=1034943 RepID=UPI001FE0223E|nr:GGDEF domain-containing protein [Legionella massiliensis]
MQAIPFNIVISGLLCLEFIYKKIPYTPILLWFLGIVIVSLIRLFYCKYVVSHHLYQEKNAKSALLFLMLTLLMGCLWGACYLIFIPYLSEVNEVTVILIFGGLSAGAATSLSGYLPAYYSYIFPMFLPVIIYNYSFFEVERAILATMFILFVIMVATIAKTNSNLLEKILQLDNQKDFLIKELSISNKKLEASNEEIRVMSITDPLTGLYNRRYFDNALLQELNRAKRNKYPLGLILIDIDNFKFINDNFGHPYGDSYLVFVASVLKKSMRRTTDVLVRLGGDEFAVILSNIPITEVSKLCESIREEFSKENRHKNVTLSIGLICIEPGQSTELNNIVSAADKLLYKAKEKGKNQTITRVL